MKTIKNLSLLIAVITCLISCDQNNPNIEMYDYVVSVNIRKSNESYSLGEKLEALNEVCSSSLNEFIHKELNAGEDSEVLVHCSLYKNYNKAVDSGSPIFEKLCRWSFWVKKVEGVYEIHDYSREKIAVISGKSEMDNWMKDNLKKRLLRSKIK